jgi:hypothetical protein
MSAEIRTEAIVLPDAADPGFDLWAAIRPAILAAGIVAATLISCALAVLLHVS